MRPSTKRGSVAGKLMFAGEYAVLSGRCPALAAAVSELASWRLSEGPATIELTAFDRTWSWSPDGTAPEGIGSLVQAALDGAATVGWRLNARLRLEIRGQVAGHKVGLGTSSAAVVAAVRAAAASAHVPPPEAEIAAVAQRVHRASQGGRGSGYDVATLLAGGCIAYDRPTQSARPLAWPKQLFAAALFTGTSFRTTSAIRTPLPDSALDEIAAATAGVLVGWAAADEKAVIAAFERCEAAFDAAAKYRDGLLTDALRNARSRIRQAGCQPRISGAGGGDCVLAFADDPDRISALVRGWKDAGGLVVAELPRDISAAQGIAAPQGTELP